MMTDFKDWLLRRKMDFKFGDMTTLITLESFKNSKGQVELIQKWEYIRKNQLSQDAKELTGVHNCYLLDKTEEQIYPDWAVNQKSLTATGAYDWLLSSQIYNKIYNEFKDWQHIDLKTALFGALILIGAIYGLYVMLG